MLVCLSVEAPLKAVHHGSPCWYMKFGDIAYSITVTCSHHSMTTDRRVGWFPDWETQSGQAVRVPNLNH